MSPGTRRTVDREASASADRRVRECLARGDPRGAATAALRAHGPAALRYLRGITATETDAVEAFSLFSERVWRGLSEFREESALRTWMFRVAWSAASDLRKDGWRTYARRLATSEAEAIPDGNGSRSQLKAERQRRALDDARRTLPLEDQALLQLRVDQGLSWAECAEALSLDGETVSTGALMKRFERVKKLLGKTLAGVGRK